MINKAKVEGVKCTTILQVKRIDRKGSKAGLNQKPHVTISINNWQAYRLTHTPPKKKQGKEKSRKNIFQTSYGW